MCDVEGDRGLYEQRSKRGCHSVQMFRCEQREGIGKVLTASTFEGFVDSTIERWWQVMWNILCGVYYLDVKENALVNNYMTFLERGGHGLLYLSNIVSHGVVGFDLSCMTVVS